jgi:hypothetical protein
LKLSDLDNVARKLLPMGIAPTVRRDLRTGRVTVELQWRGITGEMNFAAGDIAGADELFAEEVLRGTVLEMARDHLKAAFPTLHRLEANEPQKATRT